MSIDGGVYNNGESHIPPMKSPDLGLADFTGRGYIPWMNRAFLAGLFFTAAVIALTARAEDGSSAADRFLNYGRCLGKLGPDTPPPDDEPFDLKNDREFENELEDWKQLGYRRNGDRLIDPHGKIVSAAKMAWLRGPADFTKEKIDYQLWRSLTSDWRLDETSCRMVSNFGSALSRIQLSAAEMALREANNTLAIENLKIRLNRVADAKELNDVAAHVKRLQTVGAGLPDELNGLFDGSQTRGVGGVKWAVDQAYVRQTKRNDSSSDFNDLMKSARPREFDFDFENYWVNRDADKRFGELLGNLVRNRFEHNAAGLELLRRLSDSKGRVLWPSIDVSKHSQHPEESKDGAFAKGENNISINFWSLLTYVFADIPQQQWAMRIGELSDPARLRNYLLSNPRAMKSLIDRLDVTLYHEMTHNVQFRSTSLGSEMLRGNLPGRDLLPWEIEAFRAEHMYALSQAAEHPDRFEKIDNIDQCLMMLFNYNQFKRQIAEDYQKNVIGSQQGDEIKDIQEERKAVAERLRGGGGLSREIQDLKLAGYKHGDKALDQFDRYSNYQERQFKFIQLPALINTLIESDLARKIRPDYGVRLAVGLNLEDHEIKELESAFLERPETDFDFQSRVAAIQTLQAHYRSKKVDIPERVTNAFHREAATAVNTLLDEIAHSTDHKVILDDWNTADSWAKELPADHPAAQRYHRELAERNAAESNHGKL